MGHFDNSIYDAHSRMSYREKQEMWARQSRRERLREEKEEWEAECRRDEND